MKTRSDTKANVYFDVENTLELPFITGIQRVVREFSKVVLDCENRSLFYNYVPVVYDHDYHSWRRLHKFETRALVSNTPRSTGLISRISHRLKKRLPVRHLLLKQFTSDTVFLDIESSWHSKLKRGQLLPKLVASHVKLAKLHYDIIPLLFPETSHPNTVELFSEHFYSHLEHTPLFLCISETTRKDVINYCQDHTLQIPSMNTIRLGTSPTAVLCRKMTGRASKHDTSEHGAYILSVGTIEPRKNFSLLLDAFTQFASESDLNLVIVGKTGWRADQIINKIRQHKFFGKRVFHLDKVDDDLLNRLYTDAWLNVVPSLYEGFGLPVVESLSRGCPTLCSDAGSLGEFDTNIVMMFESNSSEALYEALARLYQNVNDYETLVANTQRFKPVTWKETATEIDASIYDFYQ